jgi:hypothetical protein
MLPQLRLLVWAIILQFHLTCPKFSLSGLQVVEDTHIFWSPSGGLGWSRVCPFCTKFAVGIYIVFMQLKFLLLTFASAAWWGRELCCICLRTSCARDSSWSAKYNRQVNLPDTNHLFQQCIWFSCAWHLYKLSKQLAVRCWRTLCWRSTLTSSAFLDVYRA